MSSPSPVILIPPSEGKRSGGGASAAGMEVGAFAVLGDAREVVRDAVRRVIRRRAAAEALLGVRGAHLERALAEWAALDDAPTLPAAHRYSGVVWGALGVDDMSSAVRQRLMARVVVPSGLWGLVAAGDPIPAYRLKMGARLPRLGQMSAYWRPVISEALAARAGHGAVIDLLPREHSAAIDWTVLRPGRRVRVDVVEDDPGGRRAVGHAGKSLKGALARAMLVENACTAADISGLVVSGLGPGNIEEDGAVLFRKNA